MTGEQLRLMADRLQLMPRDMAKLCGVGVRTYYRYEKLPALPMTLQLYLFTLLKYPHILADHVARVKGVP